MNKKEIAEIKKLFTKERCCLNRISGCYVDAEKNKVLTFTEPFLSVQEGEMYKYFDIFRKSLSGTIGKNLLNMEFPLEQELEGGTASQLLALRDGDLKDEAQTEELFDRIIASYYHPENYLILLVSGAYDIPMRTSDGFEMEDASDYVYRFIMGVLCPVNLSKAGLCYNAETQAITDRIRDWIVGMPEQGFLYPAFTDRNTDVHQMLFYSKTPDELPTELFEQVFGCIEPVTAGEQKASFAAIVEETFGEDLDFEVAKTIHENLMEIMEEAKDEPDPVELDQAQLKRLMSGSGATEEQIESFDQSYAGQFEKETPLMAGNLAQTRKFEIKTPEVVVRVNPDRTDLVETRVIDGRQYLMIALTDEVEVNGLMIHGDRPEADAMD